MKFSKKMIMIPEEEYNALLNLFSGVSREYPRREDFATAQRDDSLKAEKAMTEYKMSKVIRNPNLSELEKGKKYDILYKKRRQLNKRIEDRPHKVVIDNESSQSLPTSGVVPAHIIPSQLRQNQQKDDDYTKKISENAREASEESEDPPYSSFREEFVQEIEPKKYQTRIKSGIIKPAFYGELKNLLNKQQDRLGITPEGNFYRHLSDKNPIKDSDTEKVLQHILGIKEAESPGIEFLYRRLMNEPKFQDIMEKSGLVKETKTREKMQKGSGKKSKKYIIEKVNPNRVKKTYKTKGLPRVNKFKPKLWVKLGI